MKSFRTTLIFLVLVAGVGGFAIYEYRRGVEEEQKQAEAGKIFTFTEDQVSFLEVSRPDGNLKLKKEGDEWKIISPVEDEADLDSVNRYLKEISEQRAREVTAPKMEAQTISWAHYGLDQPGTQWNIELTTGLKMPFVISKNSAFDGSFFMRIQDKLYLGGTSWSHLNAQTAEALRDRRVFRYKGKVKGITLLNFWGKKAETVKLVKDDNGWQAADAKDLLLDETRIQRFIDELRDMRANEFAAENSDKKTDKNFGLDKPILKIELSIEGDDKDKTTTVFHSEVGMIPKKNTEDTKESKRLRDMVMDDFFIRSSHRPIVYKLDKGLADKLDALLSDFRDGREPFRFDVEKASKIQVNAELAQLVFAKDGQQWKLESGGDSEKVINEEKLVQFVQKLAAMEARGFVPANEGKKVKLNNSAKIFDKEGQTILDFMWGGETVKLERGRSKNEPVTLVKTNKVADYAQISSVEITNLPLQELIKKKEKPRKKLSDSEPTSSGEAK